MNEKIPEGNKSKINSFSSENTPIIETINSSKIKISDTNPFLKIDIKGLKQEKKVLVIEDDESIRFLITSALEYEDYKVLEAANGVEGFLLAKENLPDLIISDIMMPQMDGFETLTKLKNDPETANIPFIFLTSLHNPASIRLSEELGASNYILKPFKAKEVLQVVDKQIIPTIK
jgi:CheY-like chemotaxis protein